MERISEDKKKSIKELKNRKASQPENIEGKLLKSGI